MFWVVFTWNHQLYEIICDESRSPQKPKHLLNEIAYRSIFSLNQSKDFNLIMLRSLPSKQYNSFRF